MKSVIEDKKNLPLKDLIYYSNLIKTSSKIVFYSLTSFESLFSLNLNVENAGQFYFNEESSIYIILDTDKSAIQSGKIDFVNQSIELKY